MYSIQYNNSLKLILEFLIKLHERIFPIIIVLDCTYAQSSDTNKNAKLFWLIHVCLQGTWFSPRIHFTNNFHPQFAFWLKAFPLHDCNSICGHQITTKFCTCNYSCAVVACAKFCSDHIITISITAKLIFLFILNCAWKLMSVMFPWSYVIDIDKWQSDRPSPWPVQPCSLLSIMRLAQKPQGRYNWILWTQKWFSMWNCSLLIIFM